MNRKILKKMNKDIDSYYVYQKDELKDILHIPKNKRNLFIPQLILIISICFCIYLYQNKQPTFNSIIIPQYHIKLNKDNLEVKKESNPKMIEENTNNFIIQFEHYQYNDIYILSSLNILIIFYILYKKHQ